jgi:hypothetical protein
MTISVVNTRYGYQNIYKNGQKICLEIDAVLHSDVIHNFNKRYVQIIPEGDFKSFVKEICENVGIRYYEPLSMKLPFKFHKYNVVFENSDDTLAHCGQLVKDASVKMNVELTGVQKDSNQLYWSIHRVTFKK